MSGPAKLNDPNIPYVSINLNKLMYFADSLGLGGKNTVEAFIAFIGATTSTPVRLYNDMASLYENTVIPSFFFAYVTDASAHPDIEEGWALFLYNGGARDEEGSYILIQQEQEVTRFKGIYVSEAQLVATVTEANAGDYAYVDNGPDYPLQLYLWDANAEEWVVSITSGGSLEVYAGATPANQIVGGVNPGYDPTGKTSLEILEDILVKYINPVVTAFSITGQATTVEVGTTISGAKTFTWSITENSGDVDEVDIVDVTAASDLETATPNDGSQSTNVGSYQLNANGAQRQYQLDAHDIGKIPSQVIQSSLFTIVSRFYRFFSPTATSPANSADVRTLANSAFHTGGTFTFATGTSATKFVIALPPGATVTSVIDTSALNADITGEFILTGTINVLDAGGTNRAYNIYEMNVSIPYSTSHNFSVTTTAAS